MNTTSRMALPDPILARALRQGGFGLLEITAALFVTAMLVGLFTRELERSFENAQIDHARAGILILAEALYAYRINELDSAGRPKREWPADFTALQDYAPSFASSPPGGRNGVGQPYRVIPPSPLTSNDPIEVRTDMLTNDYAALLSREFPGYATVSGSTVTVEIPVPGHEPARDSLLALDGSRDMSGNLGLATNDISNADEVRVNTRVQVGGNTVTPGLVGFLNGAYGESCGGGVTISGSSTSCFTPTCTACTAACPCPPPPACPPPPICPP